MESDEYKKAWKLGSNIILKIYLFIFLVLILVFTALMGNKFWKQSKSKHVEVDYVNISNYSSIMPSPVLVDLDVKKVIHSYKYTTGYDGGEFTAVMMEIEKKAINTTDSNSVVFMRTWKSSRTEDQAAKAILEKVNSFATKLDISWYRSEHIMNQPDFIFMIWNLSMADKGAPANAELFLCDRKKNHLYFLSAKFPQYVQR